MDILTEKGQATLRDEQAAAAIFVSHYPSVIYAETPKDKPSDVDAVLVKNNTIRGVVETKCRYDCDLHKFTTQYHSSWLVTFEKLEKGRNLARQLQVPFIGFLYLVPSQALLYAVLANSEGEYVRDMEKARTSTRACVNGGTAMRMNAYIDMKGIKPIYLK